MGTFWLKRFGLNWFLEHKTNAFKFCHIHKPRTPEAKPIHCCKKLCVKNYRDHQARVKALDDLWIV